MILPQPEGTSLLPYNDGMPCLKVWGSQSLIKKILFLMEGAREHKWYHVITHETTSFLTVDNQIKSISWTTSFSISLSTRAVTPKHHLISSHLHSKELAADLCALWASSEQILQYETTPLHPHKQPEKKTSQNFPLAHFFYGWIRYDDHGWEKKFKHKTE